MSVENPTYLEKLESYLGNVFGYLLNDAFESNYVWGMREGKWRDALGFFESLTATLEYVLDNRHKPLTVRGDLSHFNQTEKPDPLGPGTGGMFTPEFVRSLLPVRRQRIFLFHALGLLLKQQIAEQKAAPNDVQAIYNISQELLHETTYGIFSYLEHDYRTGLFDELARKLGVLGSLSLKLECAIKTLALALEQHGFAYQEVAQLSQQRFLFNKYPPDPRLEPASGLDWQMSRTFGGLYLEIEFLQCLVWLETSWHSALQNIISEPSVKDELGPRLAILETIVSQETASSQPATTKRGTGGTQYQNLLAGYYLLKYAKANCNNTQTAKFISFLTGWSENTLRQQLSNLHQRQDDDGVAWTRDMETVRDWLKKIGLDEAARMVENDLDSK